MGPSRAFTALLLAFATQEMTLLTEVEEPGSSIDTYVSDLDRVLAHKIEVQRSASLRTRFRPFPRPSRHCGVSVDRAAPAGCLRRCTVTYSLQIIARLRAKLSEFKGRLREEERLSRSINERHGH